MIRKKDMSIMIINIIKNFLLSFFLLFSLNISYLGGEDLSGSSGSGDRNPIVLIIIIIFTLIGASIQVYQSAQFYDKKAIKSIPKPPSDVNEDVDKILNNNNTVKNIIPSPEGLRHGLEVCGEAFIKGFGIFCIILVFYYTNIFGFKTLVDKIGSMCRPTIIYKQRFKIMVIFQFLLLFIIFFS